MSSQTKRTWDNYNHLQVGCVLLCCSSNKFFFVEEGCHIMCWTWLGWLLSLSSKAWVGISLAAISEHQCSWPFAWSSLLQSNKLYCGCFCNTPFLAITFSDLFILLWFHVTFAIYEGHHGSVLSCSWMQAQHYCHTCDSQRASWSLHACGVHRLLVSLRVTSRSNLHYTRVLWGCLCKLMELSGLPSWLAGSSLKSLLGDRSEFVALEFCGFRGIFVTAFTDCSGSCIRKTVNCIVIACNVCVEPLLSPIVMELVCNHIARV